MSKKIKTEDDSKDSDLGQLSKTTKGDIAYAMTKAGLGSIPILGAAASEILGLIVSPPLENRKTKFLTDVGERLKALEESKELNLVDLIHNQEFVDTVLQATTYALKTSEVEKVMALKNAILNTAIGDHLDSTTRQIFLNLIDGYTAWHIKILYFFDDPEEWFRVRGRNAPNYMAGSMMTVLTDAFPELKTQRELVNIIWADLGRAGLQNSSDLSTTMSGSGVLSKRTTEMGEKFLNYILEAQ